MTNAQILVVEDESIIAEHIQDGLKRLGYAVSAVVSSGEEAIQKVEETHPDLVLMDIVLKGNIDGVEAAKEIRTRLNIPVVYLTAYSNDSTFQRAKITEPYGYILKPFEERELRTTIEMALYKHKMERRLKESEEWLTITLKSIGDAVIATDKNELVTFMNPVAEKLTGWNQEDALGKDLREIFNIINEETRSVIESPVTKVLREGIAVNLVSNTTLITKNGMEIPINDIGAPIRDERRNIIGVVLIFRDITEHKQAIGALMAEQERLSVTLQSIKDGIIAIDTDSRIILANRAGQEYLALLTNVGIGDVLTHIGKRPLTELLNPPKGKIYHEVIIQGPPRRVFELNAQLIKVGPQVSGWVLIIRDSTEERIMHQRMVTQERLAAVGQLAAGIAHNFNNALTAIIGFSQLLLNDPSLSDKAQKRLDSIIEQGRRASHFTSQILDFCQQSVSEQNPLNLLPFLKENVKLLKHFIPEHIKITLEFTPEECWISADPVQIYQVFINLALNARDAMPEGGELKIQITKTYLNSRMHPPFLQIPPGNWVRLSVSDTGTGIAPEHMSHIFEPFFTSKEVGKGSGLGLAQVHGIVKQHNGFIDVTSEVSEGTTFNIYLPAIVGKEVVAPEVPEEEAVGGPKRRDDTVRRRSDNA